MKKIIGLLCLLTFTQMLFAQDFKKVQGILLLKKFDAAKIEYDKLVTKNATLATTPDGVYLKAFIHDGLAKDSLLSKKFPTAFDFLESMRLLNYKVTGLRNNQIISTCAVSW
jgi:hypothetical protein